MKELIIARHAKSSWKNTEIIDIERPLNKRGYTDANAMGRFLKLKRTEPDFFISSPAIRAFSTASIYARFLNFNYENFKVSDVLYNGYSHDIIDLLKTIPSQAKSIIIFGHNPTFTDLANYFTFADIENIPTSGIVSIHFDVADWDEINENNGKLNYFKYPKNLTF